MDEDYRIIENEWHGLYGEGWKGLIVDEAFGHPAKYSRALIRRIYDHVCEERWCAPGDSIIDAFGGVALGAFDAMRQGLRWTGCELEQRFVDLGNQNIELWNERYAVGLGEKWGSARILQGDSRQLSEVISKAGLSVSSPPYINSINSKQHGIDWMKSEKDYPGRVMTEQRAAMHDRHHNDRVYGESEGQLGAMPEGEHWAAMISSPPYFQPNKGGGGINVNGYGDGSDKVGERSYQARGGERAPGNLETLAEGEFRAAISSPPYLHTHVADSEANKLAAQGEARKIVDGARDNGLRYGQSAGQISTMSVDTFWSAARTILEQVYSVLTSSGHAVFVVKDFVRKGQRVEFTRQWAEMCEAVGFRLLHHHRAMLVEHYGTQGALYGEDTQIEVARKSFFRRLHEKKNPHLKIDWESVLCFVKGE